MKDILYRSHTSRVGRVEVTWTRTSSVFATQPTGAWLPGGMAATLGTPFTVGRCPVRVTALGYLDETGEGLVSGHTVGIYDRKQRLLGSARVPSGLGTPYRRGTRWVKLDQPILLAANTGYTLAFTISSAGDRVNFVPSSQVTIDSLFALASEGFTIAQMGILTYPELEASRGTFAIGGNMEVEAESYDLSPARSTQTRGPARSLPRRRGRA